MQAFLDAVQEQIQTLDMGDVVTCAGVSLGVVLIALLVTIRSGRRVKVIATRAAPMAPALRLKADQSWNRVAHIVDGGVIDADVVATAHLCAGRQLDAADYALGRLKAECRQVMLAQDELMPDPVQDIAPALGQPAVAA